MIAQYDKWPGVISVQHDSPRKADIEIKKTVAHMQYNDISQTNPFLSVNLMFFADE